MPTLLPAFIILAAGRGTRMNSPLSKMMHEVGGLALLGHILSTVSKLATGENICVVLSPDMVDVESYCHQQVPNIKIAYQSDPQGTAHAVSSAQKIMSSLLVSDVIIMAGDTPLIEPETLQQLINRLQSKPDDAGVVLAMRVQSPNAYGRLIVDADNNLEHIVEVKDASSVELAIELCNSGVLAIKAEHLMAFLPIIEPNHITGEYYLTDITKLMRQQGHKVAIIETSAEQVFGINTQADLAVAQNIFQNKKRQQAMVAGVTLVDPNTVYFSHDSQIAAGVVIHPHVILSSNVTIDTDAQIKSFSHLEDCHIKSGAKIGPFARIRGASVIDEDARVGNFVEIKKTYLGTGSKVGHLTYLGDAVIGKQCNIGAGTITVNYDGVNKWPTHIKDRVFVGSNASLIAPLIVHEGAMIAAGSTITKNISANALAVGRSRQIELAEGATRLRQKIVNKKFDK